MKKIVFGLLVLVPCLYFVIPSTKVEVPKAVDIPIAVDNHEEVERFTEQEVALFNLLLTRKNDPKVNDLTKAFILRGFGVETVTENGKDVNKVTEDWRKVTEPVGLTEEGKKVFWSVVKKRFADVKSHLLEEEETYREAIKSVDGLVEQKYLDDDFNTFQNRKVLYDECEKWLNTKG